MQAICTEPVVICVTGTASVTLREKTRLVGLKSEGWDQCEVKPLSLTCSVGTVGSFFDLVFFRTEECFYASKGTLYPDYRSYVFIRRGRNIRFSRRNHKFRLVFQGELIAFKIFSIIRSMRISILTSGF